jgi:hypothetical protein
MANFLGIYVAVYKSKSLIKSSGPGGTGVPEEVMDEEKTRLEMGAWWEICTLYF